MDRTSLPLNVAISALSLPFRTHPTANPEISILSFRLFRENIQSRSARVLLTLTATTTDVSVEMPISIIEH